MPNWVRNKITFYGPQERIATLKSFVVTNDSQFDFNKIHPMPEALWEAPAEEEVQICAMACYEAKEKDLNTCDAYEKRAFGYDFQDLILKGRICKENEAAFGFRDWYHWRLFNWGTKWNSTDATWNGNVCTFDTAWSTPEQIYEKLSLIFPDITFDVLFADEDLGRNCGTIHYNEDEGQVVVNYTDDLNFACRVWGTTPDMQDE